MDLEKYEFKDLLNYLLHDEDIPYTVNGETLHLRRVEPSMRKEAKRIGIPYRTIQNYARGISVPPLYLQKALVLEILGLLPEIPDLPGYTPEE